MRAKELARAAWLMIGLTGGLALAGCGDLPRPFQGNPGVAGSMLVQPPPARLAVVPAPGAGLSPEAGAALTGAVAHALQAREVPAVAEPARKGDWRLEIGAERRAGQVVATFAEQNPKGVEQSRVEAAPVPEADWSQGAPATMQALAAQAAPGIAAMLTAVEATRKQADPASLANRPMRVYFAGVHGAPGDGDTSLARQMRRLIGQSGQVVLDAPAGADFTLRGEAKLTPLPGQSQQIELAWRVSDAQGHDCGAATQLKEIPAGSLDSYWGDVAMVAAGEAADGVEDIIGRCTGLPATAASAAHPPAAPPKTPQP